MLLPPRSFRRGCLTQYPNPRTFSPQSSTSKPIDLHTDHGNHILPPRAFAYKRPLYSGITAGTRALPAIGMASAPPAPAAAPVIGAQEAADLLAAKAAAYVDVRTPEEFVEGHVPGSVNVPVALQPPGGGAGEGGGGGVVRGWVSRGRTRGRAGYGRAQGDEAPRALRSGGPDVAPVGARRGTASQAP
jgi:hypothetical protein